jgi:Mg-chelatase subunit ChlD
VAATLGRVVVGAAPTVVEWTTARLFGCPNPIELRVLAAPEGLATARELADRFVTQAAGDHHGCAPVRFYVYAQPSGTAQRALARGWSANDLRALGPRPDVWLPGSPQHTLDNSVVTSNGLLPGTRSVVLASTPVVLAIPKTAVPAEFDAKRTDLSLIEALTVLDQPGWSLVRPDPGQSWAGELANVAIYASGGDPERLADPSAGSTLMNGTRARDLELRISRGIDENAYPLSHDADLLCRHRQVRSVHIALVVSEQQMARFNSGRALGQQCPESTTPPTAPDQLRAIYAVDTLSLKYTLVGLDWPGRSAEQRQWIGRFEAWLGADAGKEALSAAGLRPPDYVVGHPLIEPLGAQPGVSYSHVTPDPSVLQSARHVHAAAQRSGRVLLAVDASGSMESAAGTDGQNRFAVAAAAVSQSLSLMSPRDEFGLWVFQGSGRPARRLVPVGPIDAIVEGATRREATVRELREVTPGGDTPLYRVIVDGVRALSPPDPTRVNALVVLTDGKDHGSGVSPADMVNGVRGKGIRVFVIAIGEASCGVQAVQETTRTTAGGCFEANSANLDATLSELFRVLWGGS